eukprot:5886931-Pyramimonas_sp.AAC.1
MKWAANGRHCERKEKHCEREVQALREGSTSTATGKCKHCEGEAQALRVGYGQGGKCKHCEREVQALQGARYPEQHACARGRVTSF